MSGDAITVAGADAAASPVIEAGDDSVVGGITATAIGDVVMIAGAELGPERSGQPVPDLAPVDAVAEVGVAKVRSVDR